MGSRGAQIGNTNGLKHGMSRSNLYKAYARMKARCHDTGRKYYHGRGITVCSEWESDFIAFQTWAENNGYEEGLSIDRIDVDKGYSPDNCRWIPLNLQKENKRHRLSKYTNERTDFKALAELHGINHSTLCWRIQRGKSLEEALRRPT